MFRKQNETTLQFFLTFLDKCVPSDLHEECLETVKDFMPKVGYANPTEEDVREYANRVMFPYDRLKKARGKAGIKGLIYEAMEADRELNCRG